MMIISTYIDTELDMPYYDTPTIEQPITDYTVIVCEDEQEPED